VSVVLLLKHLLILVHLVRHVQRLVGLLEVVAGRRASGHRHARVFLQLRGDRLAHQVVLRSSLPVHLRREVRLLETREHTLLLQLSYFLFY